MGKDKDKEKKDKSSKSSKSKDKSETKSAKSKSEKESKKSKSGKSSKSATPSKVEPQAKCHTKQLARGLWIAVVDRPHSAVKLILEPQLTVNCDHPDLDITGTVLVICYYYCDALW